MKIQFVIISDSGDQTYSSIAEYFTDAKDAAIFVQETIESNPNLTHCTGCEALVDGHVGETIYCKKCQKYIPDDSDFSSAVDEV